MQKTTLLSIITMCNKIYRFSGVNLTAIPVNKPILRLNNHEIAHKMNPTGG